MNDSEAVLKKAGVYIGDDADRSIVHRAADSTVLVGGVARPAASMSPVTCSICFESKVAYSALQCGHPFCNQLLGKRAALPATVDEKRAMEAKDAKKAAAKAAAKAASLPGAEAGVARFPSEGRRGPGRPPGRKNGPKKRALGEPKVSG